MPGIPSLAAAGACCDEHRNNSNAVDNLTRPQLKRARHAAEARKKKEEERQRQQVIPRARLYAKPDYYRTCHSPAEMASVEVGVMAV